MTAKTPNAFAFTAANKKRADLIISRYPAGRQQSALLPLLDIAQRQNSNWLSKETLEYVAEYLNLPIVRVYEVASFYTMFNLKPVGENLVQLCCTTPCWLRGSDAVEDACKEHLGIGLGETTPDGKFTLMRVECLGACVNAPVVQINDDFFEDLDKQAIVSILQQIQDGRKPKTGSQIGRQFSAPVKKAG